MVRNIYKPALLVLLFVFISFSDSVGNQPEVLKSTDNDVKTAQSEKQRYCNCQVTIEQDDDRRNFLLTFHFEPYNNNVNPTFYMSEQITGGVGLKVKKVFPYDDAEIKVNGEQVPEFDENGKLITISSSLRPGSIGYYDFFNGRDGRTVLFQQRVWLQDRFPSEEGLYAVTYEHPWEELEGTNVRFHSNTLLVSVTSSQRMDGVYSLVKDNPELELARYQMMHPTNSEFAKYRRPLKFLDNHIHVGMDYDEVLFLMGPPDSPGLDKDNWRWGYDTSPVGGFWIIFKNGKVVGKNFSFDQS